MCRSGTPSLFSLVKLREVLSTLAGLIQERNHLGRGQPLVGLNSLRGFIYASGAMLILYQTKIGHPLQMITF